MINWSIQISRHLQYHVVLIRLLQYVRFSDFPSNVNGLSHLVSYLHICTYHEMFVDYDKHAVFITCIYYYNGFFSGFLTLISFVKHMKHVQYIFFTSTSLEKRYMDIVVLL